MARGTASLPRLTIPSGSSTSNALLRNDLRFSGPLAISAPAGLDALDFTIEVSLDPDLLVWATLSGYELESAEVLVIPETPFFGLRILASGNVAADRTFLAAGQE